MLNIDRPSLPAGSRAMTLLPSSFSVSQLQGYIGDISVIPAGNRKTWKKSPVHFDAMDRGRLGQVIDNDAASAGSVYSADYAAE